jgi:hypothetical protein
MVVTRGGSRALRLRGFLGVTDFSIFHMVGLYECSLASEGATYLDDSTRSGTAVYGSTHPCLAATLPPAGVPAQ